MDIQQLSASAIIDAVRSGSIKVRDIAQQTNSALETHKDLNAVISSDDKLLMDNAHTLDKKFADGKILPLHGLPILVKDNIDTIDFRTSGGTAALADHQPSEDAGVIKLLKKAGAMIVGKSNMHELAFGITSNNAFTGAVHNPYDRKLIPGGSSGGSAAAVSANLVAVALGSDTGGSNRIPAALCGIYGFRPTTGRYPDDGLINLSKTRDTVGVFARSVSDVALIDNVLAGGCQLPQININELRLAVPRDPFYKALENETSAVIEDTLSRLATSGAKIIEINMQDLFALNDKISFPIALYETLRELTDYLQRNIAGVSLAELIATVKSPDVKHILQASQGELKVPQQVYQDAVNIYRPQLQQMYADYFNDKNIDAMLYPTTPLTARLIGDDETVELNGRRSPTFPSYVRNSDPSSNAGIPSLSIPAGLSTAGLPVGLAIDGPVNQDAKILAIGAAFAAVIPPIKGPAL